VGGERTLGEVSGGGARNEQEQSQRIVASATEKGSVSRTASA
jgi:hypothetical protein